MAKLWPGVGASSVYQLFSIVIGGFIMWLELNKKIDAFKLRAEAVKHKIAIVPGKIFSSGSKYSNFIRLSFGKPWSEDVDYGLMMLGRLIRKMV